MESPHNEPLLSNDSTSSPSGNGNYTSDIHTFIKIMKLQNLISRGVYVYSVFGLVGLLMGIFILITYIRNFSKKSKFEKLDIFIFTVTVADFMLILFSLTDIVRPNPVMMSALCCAILSFSFNLPYFYTEYIHVVISFFLVSNHIAVARRALSKPPFTILAVMGLSILWSALITALIGVSDDLNKELNCYLDPFDAPAKYSIVKFVFGFLIPTLIILGSILHFLIHSTCMQSSNNLQACRESFYPHRIFLALVTVTFICRLVYNVLLLLRREAVDDYSHREKELIVIIGELTMFVGSCLCLVSIVALDEKMKHAVRETSSCFTKPC
ncbi:nociceptin receptor-like [Pristis pectinata]|uniref:nociceptin receptor-like n=1 Tax=Pristis pectinata TaxID=685728 RepID=UPI00223CDE1C|nr:nociceptin receptor-like [Pristis pectinata]XP_051876925.1 nociceptin receptor-like [Pristis pectinata]